MRVVDAFVAMTIVLILIGLALFGIDCQRWTEERALIKKSENLVQAIIDYKAGHGHVPKSLNDLIPEYISQVPKAWSISATEDRFYIANRGGPFANGVTYSFSNTANEGWSVPGYPKISPTRPVVSRDSLIDARLQELDQQISQAASPDSLDLRELKIAYLISVGRTQDASAECESLTVDAPQWWVPQYGLAVLADVDHVSNAEKRFHDWADANPTFLNYYFLARYYRNKQRLKEALAALEQGAKYPINEPNPLFPRELNSADGFALEAATFSNEQRDHQLTLEISEQLSSYSGYQTRRRNMDYCAFQAAAQLGLGHLEDAQKSATLAIESEKARSGSAPSIVWARNIERLQKACEKGEITFFYNPGPVLRAESNNWDWLARQRKRLADF